MMPRRSWTNFNAFVYFPRRQAGFSFAEKDLMEQGLAAVCRILFFIKIGGF